MKNNTVVTAGDMNYFWGVFLLAASMRKHGMDEPILVFADKYTPQAKELLTQFAPIRIVDAPPSKRSMTCRKAEAMLCADTEFMTWIDCDGFFSGNCSGMLAPERPEEIHVRLRGAAEMTGFRRFYGPGETHGAIPKAMTDVWQRDVGERSDAALPGCVSACALSIGATRRDFLERWDRQMKQVLPDDNVGVTDSRTTAYFQTDESVLNSLLSFMKDAPPISSGYRLNRKPGPIYIHFVCHPKPWKGWTDYSFTSYDAYIDVVKWLISQNYRMPGALPFSLRPGLKILRRLSIPVVTLCEKGRKLRRKLSAGR